MTAKRTPRRFVAQRAERQTQKAFVSFSGASGGGKTKSAQEFAEGIVAECGGEVFGVDTENGRMLKYAPPPGEARVRGVTYDFTHVPFEPPFDPESYLDALRHCEKLAGPAGGVVIFDSMSHEHAGPGGRLDSSAEEADRLAERSRHNKNPESHRFSAFRPNSRGRNALLWEGFFLSSLHVILCFRAKESYEQVGSKIIDKGFTPVGGQDFLFEADCSILFMPGAKGVPIWQSEKLGEKTAIKLPQEYDGIINDGRPICVDHGRRVARWLIGGGKIARPGDASRPVSISTTTAADETTSPQRSNGGASPNAPPSPPPSPPPPAGGDDSFPGDRPLTPATLRYGGFEYCLDDAPELFELPRAIDAMNDAEVRDLAAALFTLVKRAPLATRRAWFDAQAPHVLRIRARNPSFVTPIENLLEPVGARAPTDAGAPPPGGDEGAPAKQGQGDF